MIVRQLLSHPAVYRAHMLLLGGRRTKKKLLASHLDVDSQSRLLDFGCGPALDRDLLGGVRWTGIDAEERYVRYVEQRLRVGDRIFHGDVSTLRELGERFDVILLSGVLHHLDDLQAQSALSDAKDLLSSGGYILTIDPMRVDGASRLETFFIDMDRGKHIRHLDEYQALIPQEMSDVRHSIHVGRFPPQAQLVMTLHA